MWWDGSKPVDVYVGTRAIAASAGGEPLLVESVSGFDAGMKRLRVWLNDEGPKRAYRVWVSGGLCRPFLLPLIEGVRGAGELQKLAESMAPQRTGLDGPCVVRLSKRERATQSVAVAMLESTMATMEETFGDRHSRMKSVRPWWSEVLRYALQRNAGERALGVQDCDSLTVLMGEAGGFSGATTLTPVIDETSARAAFKRAVLTTDLGDTEPAWLRLRTEVSQLSTRDIALAPFVEAS